MKTTMKGFETMRVMIFVTSVTLLGMLAACDPSDSTKGTTSSSNLAMSYVSGHLGSYWDCPEQANGNTAATPGPSMAEAADCDGEGCGILNCEAAEVTLQLQNNGVETVNALDVHHVLLINENPAEPTDLEVLSWSVVPEGALDDGLSPDETITIRIQFRGPAPVNFQQMDQATPIHIEVEDGEGATVELTTPPLSVLPMMVT